MLGLIVGLIIIGIIAGYLARLLVPGKQDLTFLETLLVGVVGSFVGGFIGYLIFHKDSQDGFVQPSGWLGSIVGAIIVLLVYVRVRGGNRGVRS